MARLGHGRKKVPGKGDKLPYHGREAGYGAFVYPDKAPHPGSFPIGDLWHARYAVILVMSSTFDGSPAKREKVLRDVAEEWPQYNWAAFWNKTAKKKSDLKSWDSLVGVASKKRRKAANPRRNTMARRRNAGRVRILRNPLGMPLGKGQAVRVQGGKRTHILNPRTGRALCDTQGRYGPLSPSAAKSIDCYRCIKIRTVDGGDDVERIFAPGPGQGKRETHMMVPGGRQGRYVSGVKPSDVIGGIDMFLGGDFDDPTQSRTLSRAQKAARRTAIRRGRFKMVRKRAPAVRGRGEMVANPRSYQQGYQRGAQDYHEPTPIAASQLTQRTLSYQEGYLEGYADQSSSKPRRKNTKRRSNTRRRSNRGGETKKGRMSNGRMWYMVDGKFATKAQYDRG